MSRYSEEKEVKEFHDEYFVPQNTGWTNGLDWFDNGKVRYCSFKAAMASARRFKEHMNDPAMKHRILKVETTQRETSFEV